MKLELIPYIVILVANLLYIYTYSYDPEKHKVQIFLFNFGIMALAGIFIVIRVNMLLHKWIVQQNETDSSGKLTKKGHMKK